MTHPSSEGTMCEAREPLTSHLYAEDAALEESRDSLSFPNERHSLTDASCCGCLWSNEFALRNSRCAWVESPPCPPRCAWGGKKACCTTRLPERAWAVRAQGLSLLLHGTAVPAPLSTRAELGEGIKSGHPVKQVLGWREDSGCVK